MKSNGVVAYPAYDLSAVLAQFPGATSFVLQCVDYADGVVELVGARSKDAPVDFAGTNAACRALDAALTAVFDDWGPEGLVLPEQIAMAYARMPESFFVEPPFHFGGYLHMSTTVAVAESFVNTVLWRKGQDPRDAVAPDERRLIEAMVDSLRQMHDEISDVPEWPANDSEPGRRSVGRGKRGASHGTRVFTLRAALEGRRGVYRDIEVHEDNTWSDLHEAIFDAFEREEEHLYAFYLTRKPCPDSWKRRRSPTIGPQMDGDEVAGQADSERTTLGDSALLPKDKLYYLFDFGDEWWHSITVTRIDEPPRAKADSYPRIVDYVGDAPSQYPDPDEE
jgi:hypothetical protein